MPRTVCRGSRRVVLDAIAGPGLRVACAARLDARHVTVAGTPDAAVTTACADSEAHIADGILWAPFAGPGTVVTSFSDYPAIAGRDGWPGRPPRRSGLRAGQPAPPGRLAADRRGHARRAGRERVARGPRRPAAHRGRRRRRDPRARPGRVRARSRPPCRSRPATCCATPAPRRAARGRRRTASRASATAAFPFPSAAAGAALGAGAMFFAGGASRPPAAPHSRWT